MLRRLNLQRLLSPRKVQVPAGQLRYTGPQRGVALASTLTTRSQRLPFGGSPTAAATVAGAAGGRAAGVVAGGLLGRAGSSIDGLEEGLSNA